MVSHAHTCAEGAANARTCDMVSHAHTCAEGAANARTCAEGAAHNPGSNVRAHPSML
jgi:hypothetical protein